MAYSEEDMRILDALQRGVEAGMRIRRARERGESKSELTDLEKEAFGVRVTFEDDPAFVPSVMRGGDAV